MKKAVKAADNSTDRVTELFQESLDEVLYRAGYEAKCTGVFPDIDIEVTCISDDKMYMPKMKLVINDLGDDIYDVVPTLTFPELTMSDTDYADTIHYWLEKWERLGKYVTQLNKFEFNLESALDGNA